MSVGVQGNTLKKNGDSRWSLVTIFLVYKHALYSSRVLEFHKKYRETC